MPLTSDDQHTLDTSWMLEKIHETRLYAPPNEPIRMRLQFIMNSNMPGIEKQVNLLKQLNEKNIILSEQGRIDMGNNYQVFVIGPEFDRARTEYQVKVKEILHRENGRRTNRYIDTSVLSGGRKSNVSLISTLRPFVIFIIIGLGLYITAINLGKLNIQIIVALITTVGTIIAALIGRAKT